MPNRFAYSIKPVFCSSTSQQFILSFAASIYRLSVRKIEPFFVAKRNPSDALKPVKYCLFSGETINAPSTFFGSFFKNSSIILSHSYISSAIIEFERRNPFSVRAIDFSSHFINSFFKNFSVFFIISHGKAFPNLFSKSSKIIPSFKRRRSIIYSSSSPPFPSGIKSV